MYSMKPINNIGYLLNHLAFVLNRQSDYALQQKLGLGFSQFKIMMVLRWNPHIQQKQIAEKLGQTEASISRQIKLLHEMSLLQTVKRPENRREHITTLTTKGEKVVDQAIEALNEYHAPVFGGLSQSQQAALIEALQAMHKQTCETDRPGACHQAFES